MKTTLQQANYFQTPAIESKPEEHKGFLSLLSKLWKNFTAIDLEPQVERKHDCMGRPFWRVFDPVNDRTQCFSTDREVCEWLERRYYV